VLEAVVGPQFVLRYCSGFIVRHNNDAYQREPVNSSLLDVAPYFLIPPFGTKFWLFSPLKAERSIDAYTEL
jgi:hypothetical protein